MRRVQLDKIASVTARLKLDRNAVLSEQIPAVSGSVIAGRILNAKTVYNTLEDVHGRMVTLQPGDVIAGALGHRDALRGFSGRVPESVAVGDVLQMLNIGGVIGIGAEPAPGVGEPFRVEVLGGVLEFPYLEQRVGVPANIGRAALPQVRMTPEDAAELPPVIALVGTSMDSGKTTAACMLIAELAREGKRIAAGKLTGVSLRRDVLAMSDCGALRTAIFTDFGVVTTNEANAVAAAHSILAHLSADEIAPPDVIVLEFGDGLLGTYGVHALLSDETIRASITKTILCAHDPVGAWGGVRLLEERFGLRTSVVAGRVTDTPAGLRFCREQLGVPTWNALADGPHVRGILFPEQLSPEQALVGGRT